MIERAGYPGVAADLDLKNIASVLPMVKEKARDMRAEGERECDRTPRVAIRADPELGRRISVRGRVLARVRGFAVRHPSTGSTVRRLADLAPRMLAVMYGPIFAGDGASALHALADDYYGRIRAGAPAPPAQRSPSHGP